MIYHKPCPPIFAPLLAHATMVRVIAIAALYQGTAVAYGLPSWPCPIWHLFGIPCPACGLSRAVVALADGDVQRAIVLHAFAPLALLALVLIACAGILPERYRLILSAAVARVEQRTGVMPLLLVVLLVYWAVRLALAPALFIQLIRG